MRKIEVLLSRGFKGRSMQKDPERAVRQTAVEIVRAAPNIRIPMAMCLEILSCGDAWLRRNVTLSRQHGYVAVSVIRAFMAEVKAHGFGGDPECYRNEHSLPLVMDLVRETFAAASSEGVDPETILDACAPRIFLHCGDRFLSRDQVLLTLGHPLRGFNRRQSPILTPLDLKMGQNKNRPFRRYSMLEAISHRQEITVHRPLSRVHLPVPETSSVL